MPAPRSSTMQRSMPGKAENGASRSTSARLIRQSKAAEPAPLGPTAISRVTPAPFFHGCGAMRRRSKRSGDATHAPSIGSLRPCARAVCAASS